MRYNYTISDKGSDSTQSNTFEIALEKARELCKGTSRVVTIKHNGGHFSESYKWDLEMNDLIPA